jgi:hypothetical protein
MKTISELNTRWWYRLVKVIYILAFLAFSIGLIAAMAAEEAPSTTEDNSSSTIRCLAGNLKSFRYSELALTGNVSLTSLNDKALGYLEIAAICEIPTPSGTQFTMNDLGLGIRNYQKTQNLSEGWKDTTLDSVLYFPKTKVVGNWYSVAGFAFLILTVLIIIFEIIRRIFYYIILGSLRPKKKEHESNTVL